MALARLPVTFLVLVLSLLQASQGQQCGLCSNINSGFGSSITLSSEPIVGVITPIKRNSLNNCKCGNNEANTNIHNTQSLTSGLQQFLNLQQPQQSSDTVTLNLQPAIGNIQSALTNQNSQQQQNLQQQNVKQSVIPVQQTPKKSCSFQFVNQEQPYIQVEPSCGTTKQNLQSSSKLQPAFEKLIQQQTLSGGLQEVQQTPVQKDISLDYLPIVNRQFKGLPSQVTDGVLLSNLGLKSNLPSILPSYTKQSTDYIISPQNSAGTNAQALVDGSQIANSLPLSLSSSQLPTNYAPNKQTPILLMPLSFQSGNLESNPQTLDLTLTPVSSFQYQQPQDKVDVVSQQLLQNSQPLQPQEQYIQVPIQTHPVQQYSTQNQDPPIQQLTQQLTPTVDQVQYLIQPVQSQSTQSQGVPNLSYQSPTIQTQIVQENATTPVQNPPMQMPMDGQSDPLVSLLLSQLQSSNSPSQGSSNQGSKSSSMKTLLPLLFDLLKDKNGGCRCPNCNCGCMNNGQDIQGMNPCINNPFMQNNYNTPTNNAQRTEKQEEPTTNTYLIINNTPQKEDSEKTNEFKPQITGGYAKQIKYGHPVQKHVSQNVIETEEKDSLKKVNDKKKAPIKEYQYQNIKNVTNESAEYESDDDYAYSYENID